jgi:hypothetical protein
MTTKEGLHFKRNAGLGVYTKDWATINYLKDQLTKLPLIGVTEKQTDHLMRVAHQISTLKSWVRLPHNDKESFINDIQCGSFAIKKDVKTVLLSQ